MIDVPTIAPVGKPTEGPVPDSPVRAALRTLYQECNGPQWKVNTNWVDESVPECLWGGVRCSPQDEVIAIALHSNNLECVFPTQSFFAGMPQLESLVLDGNPITFPFDGIDQATSLTTLDLTSTNIDSFAGIDQALALKSVYFASNGFEGSFPSELLKIPTLHRIGAAFNSMTGTIPTETAQLSNLEFLSLHDNKFTGQIPSELGRLSNLFFLLLQSNNLEGTIPTELNGLSSLRFLELSDQSLTGPVLPCDDMELLKRLNLHGNRLTGSLPANFLAATDAGGIESIDLSQNQLTGTVPSLLQAFPSDRYDLTDNRITGIDNALCDASLGGAVEAYGCDAILCPVGSYNGQGRQQLDQDVCVDCPEATFLGQTSCGASNGTNSDTPIVPPETPEQALSDYEILRKLFDDTKGSVWHRKDHWKQAGISVCEWYGVKCTTDGSDQIVQIALTANGLLGTVPAEVFQLPKLETLIVDSNNCHVNMTGIRFSGTLEKLDVSSTAITHVDGIGEARALKELHIKSNAMTGTFPNEIFGITTLEQLVFDFNHFKGPLEHHVGKLTNLRLLSGEKNNLSGVLPTQMAALTDLASLRLGRNSFAGNIPMVLEDMASLTFIDLSHQTEHGGNGLSGRLPTFGKLTGLLQVRLNANALTGTVPYDLFKRVNPEVFEYADLSSNQLSGTVPASIARLKDVFLQDNQITGLAPETCAEARGPLYASYGCDAMLCPPQTYSIHGRQQSDALACKPCSTAQFYGSVACPDQVSDGGNDDGTSDEGSPPPLAPGNDERDILVKFYQTCSGEEWDESNNWLTPTSICFWQGIRCVAGMESVEAIELGANNVEGVPPPDLFLLPNLQSLALYSNPLSNFSFEGIGRATRLKELLLDAVGLDSVAGLENAPSIENLNLRFNNLSGSIPSEIGGLATLKSLSMAYNQLSGELPVFLQDLNNLHSLLLSNNNLSGGLIVNFPPSIRRLDLSNNELSGPIPDSFLTQVPFSAQLEVDLSDNHFTSVPFDMIRFQAMQLYLKGNRINELDYRLCNQRNWNEGDVGRYGCDGLLCPSGQYAPNGRHTSIGGACQECRHSPNRHMGSSTCDDTSAAVRSLSSWLLVATGPFVSTLLLFLALQ